MKNVKSDTSLGLGVFEVDEKVFFFKRASGKNTFIVDYSVNGYEFKTYSTNATITKNKKLIDISKTKGLSKNILTRHSNYSLRSSRR